MPFQDYHVGEYKFELEHTQTKVRSFTQQKRLFDFDIIAAGQNIARVIAGSGEFNKKLMESIGDVLQQMGYLIAKYEHGHDEVITYDLVMRRVISVSTDPKEI